MAEMDIWKERLVLLAFIAINVVALTAGALYYRSLATSAYFVDLPHDSSRIIQVKWGDMAILMFDNGSGMAFMPHEYSLILSKVNSTLGYEDVGYYFPPHVVLDNDQYRVEVSYLDGWAQATITRK